MNRKPGLLLLRLPLERGQDRRRLRPGGVQTIGDDEHMFPRQGRTQDALPRQAERVAQGGIARGAGKMRRPALEGGGIKRAKRNGFAPGRIAEHVKDGGNIARNPSRRIGLKGRDLVGHAGQRPVGDDIFGSTAAFGIGHRVLHGAGSIIDNGERHAILRPLGATPRPGQKPHQSHQYCNRQQRFHRQIDPFLPVPTSLPTHPKHEATTMSTYR